MHKVSRIPSISCFAPAVRTLGLGKSSMKSLATYSEYSPQNRAVRPIGSGQNLWTLRTAIKIVEWTFLQGKVRRRWQACSTDISAGSQVQRITWSHGLARYCLRWFIYSISALILGMERPLTIFLFCLIDTTEFPKEVFTPDMDLIQAYLQYSKGLQDFKGLRSRNDY
jgi:hypothetical protein